MHAVPAVGTGRDLSALEDAVGLESSMVVSVSSSLGVSLAGDTSRDESSISGDLRISLGCVLVLWVFKPPSDLKLFSQMS